MIKNRIESH